MSKSTNPSIYKADDDNLSMSRASEISVANETHASKGMNGPGDVPLSNSQDASVVPPNFIEEEEIKTSPLLEAMKGISALDNEQLNQLFHIVKHRLRMEEDVKTQTSNKRKAWRDDEEENTTRRTKLKISPPSKYDGKDRRKAEDFLSQVEHYFRLVESDLPDEQYKVDLFGTLLSNSAWDWFIHFTQNPTYTANPSWSLVKESFTVSFASSQRKLQALDSLHQKQGSRELLAFNVEFQAHLHRYNSLCTDVADEISWRAALETYLRVLNAKHVQELKDSGYELGDQSSLLEVIQKLELIQTSNKRYASFLDSARREIRLKDNDYYQSIKETRKSVTPKTGVHWKRAEPTVSKVFKGVCNTCRQKGHKSSECPKKNDAFNPKSLDLEVCAHCGIRGHGEDRCYKKHPHLRPQNIKKLQFGELSITKRIHAMNLQESNPSVVLERSNIRCTRCRGKGHDSEDCWMNKHHAMPAGLMVKAQINNSDSYVNFFIDSGAPLSTIRRDVAVRLGLEIHTDPLGVPLLWGNGEKAASEVQVTYPVPVTIQNHTAMMSFSVIDGGEAEIMVGYNWLSKHNPGINWLTGELTWRQENCSADCILSQHVDVNNIEILKDKRVIGMMDVPIMSVDDGQLQEVKDTSTKNFIVVCEPSDGCYANKGSKILVLRTNALSEMSFERSVAPKKREYYLLTINSDTEEPVVTRTFDEYHVTQDDSFNELTKEDMLSFPIEYLDFVDVFSKSKADILPEHRIWDIAIETNDKFVPKWGPLYSLSADEMSLLKEYIDGMLEKQFIRPSSSPCGAPVLFVPKKNGKLRLCVDYRALNSMTEKDRYPLPLIDNLIDQLRESIIYTALDLKGAYNLVRIKKGDEWKTAFRTRYGHFEYNVMPFGLTNAPATFQRMMNEIFRPYLDQFVVVYLDDILVYSRNKEDHVKHVRIVLQVLRENKLYCEFAKCSFHVSEVEYLGYVISAKGLFMSQKKVSAVMDWEVPKSKVGVQSFIGFANFYRRFIKNFARIATPLHKLTKKDANFEWTADCQDAFETLKHAFVSAPILKYADFTTKFVVETDASDFAIGCVLSQFFGDDSLLHPIAYYSKKLSPVESRWEIHDKELFGIITALRVWRHYLIGSKYPVEVITDHRNLQYFMKKQKLNSRQLRWIMFLADYDFTILYCEGRKMVKADALSRKQEYNNVLVRDKEAETVLLGESRFAVNNVDVSNPLLKLFSKCVIEPYVIRRIVNGTTAIDLIQLVIQRTPTFPSFPLFLNPKRLAERRFKDMKLRNGILYKGNKIFIEDEELMFLICQAHHDSHLGGHGGISKTMHAIKSEFYWYGMDAYIRKYVASCDSCQRNKSSSHKPYGLLEMLPIPSRPWSAIGMDFVGPLPWSSSFDMVLVVICRLTKQAHFIACRSNRTAAQVADLFMTHVFRLHGLPSSIVSDRDSVFTFFLVSLTWSANGEMLKVHLTPL